MLSERKNIRATEYKLYNKSYFEAARRLRNRSLLDVNEDFSDKADAERALLDSLFKEVEAAYAMIAARKNNSLHKK